MEIIKKQIQSNAIGSCYLFYGQEEYIKAQYVQQIKNIIVEPTYEVMNFEQMSGKGIGADQIIDSAETMPFMSVRRMIVLKDSGLFKSGRKDDAAKILEYLDKIPSSTCIIFIEGEIDKRTSLYKKINKGHTAVEFNIPSDKELTYWVRKKLDEHKIKMDNTLIQYFIHIVPSGMESIVNEIKKLIDYKQGGQITKEEIDTICTHSLDVRIFELVKMIGNKDTRGALKIYSNLLEIRESPIGILAMIARQFRMILKVKYMKHQGETNQNIAARIGLRNFMVNESIQQARNFTFKQLESAIKECLEADENIKTGLIQPELAVELILIKYSSLTQVS